MEEMQQLGREYAQLLSEQNFDSIPTRLFPGRKTTNHLAATGTRGQQRHYRVRYVSP